MIICRYFIWFSSYVSLVYYFFVYTRIDNELHVKKVQTVVNLNCEKKSELIDVRDPS